MDKEYYKRYKLFSSIDSKKDSSEDVKEETTNDESSTFRLFIIKGKPYFGDSNLREYGWKIAHALTPQQKKLFEGTPGYLDYKETILYKGPQGNAVLHANYKKDKHKLKINLNSYQDTTPNTMEIVKSMFEREWECKLEDPLDKDETSNLVKKLKSN
jgi:hypothetical protein